MFNARTPCIDVASVLSKGARARQEDALMVAFPEARGVGYAVLSDGMGGHAAGDLASRVIVSEVSAKLANKRDQTTATGLDVPGLLRHCVQDANESLRAHVEASPNNHGMGGTVIATLLVEQKLYWISVGDSVLYLLRNGRLRRLNDDHSMAPQIDLMAAKGLMDPEIARTHPQRSCLTSAVMGGTIAELDCPEDPLEIEPGDIVLVASDGLQFLDDARIEATLMAHLQEAGDEIAEALLREVEALEDPEQDNISLIVMKAEAAKRSIAWPSAISLLWEFGRALTRPWLNPFRG